MIGTTVGNYRIRERLGDGGMGAVYRAVDEMLDREVAIKVLKPELARNAALIERFRQEAIALARLNHPRIATLHGLERHGESFLMIMEYVRGDTLEAIMQRSGRISWHRAAELCAAMLDALDHAHDKGVVHRDIKPANIMLSTTGSLKVMDFGIARLIGKNRQTQVGHAVGTPMYMAPEQLRGEEVDGRTDLYAAGAVLFELVTGRMAFEADSDYALMMMQLNDPPPAASHLVPEVPREIDHIISRAMAKRREDRFANATAFRRALEELVRGHGVATNRVATPETRLAPPSSPPDAPRPATPGRPVPIAETRLAPASDPQRAAVPATRLVSNTPPETRLAPNASAPATRLASGVATAESPRATLAADQRAAARWLHDWRVYAAAGGLFVATGVAVRLSRADTNASGKGDTTAVADTAARIPATVVPRDTTTTLAQTSEAPRRESAAQLVINPGSTRPVSDGVRDVAPPPATNPPPPPKSRGSETRPVRPPEEKATERADPPSEPVSSREVAPREASEADVASAIRDALQFAATSLSGRNSAAASVLSGGMQEQWASLMKEGRVSLSMTGSPEIQRRGSEASVQFDASVNVRSPFGANRRQSARFRAELQQSGGGWRVVSLEPAGRLELKQ